jgi:hypothetical protein
MVKLRKWTDTQLTDAVKHARSYRQVLMRLGLVPAGGNFSQLKRYIEEYKLDISHFTHKGWSKGIQGRGGRKNPIENILVAESWYQSFKLKRRLFASGLKIPKCEMCGWAKQSVDGRIPLELDHINGDRRDNRLANLRVLCPNCHSLQPTHRGRNKNKIARVL